MGIIDFQSVTFSYDGTAAALDDLGISIEPGTFLGVLGGNGSGKSTFAKHINALLIPDAGTVEVMGHVTADPHWTYFIRSNAGMVFQNPDDQIVASKVEDEVAFGPENLGLPPEELRRRVTEALEKVGLSGFEQHQTHELSGGQKQRVAVAGVLAMEPRIIILDEASAMLDPRGRKGLMKLCRSLHDAGFTIIMVTHFMEQALLCDRVAVLHRGSVALDGTPTEVLADGAVLAHLDLDSPFAAAMAHALQDCGVPVETCLEGSALAEQLQRLLGADADAETVLAGGEGSAGLLRRTGSALTTSENLDPGPRPFAGEKFAIASEPETRPPESERAEPVRRSKPAEPSPIQGAVQASAPEPLLSFQDVSFTYAPSPRRHRESREELAPREGWGSRPADPWALWQVSFELQRGEFLAIAGHTGSGKSTLIQLAGGLLHPTEGTVRLQGRDMAEKKEAAAVRHSVGILFQYPERQLFAATVADDVAFGPRNLGLEEAEVNRRVEEALERVHLSYRDLKDKSPFALSGGQQRRVAFAGVLAMEPDTLILDEPAAGLDPRSHDRLLRLVEELHGRQGLTVVMVSHNMDDIGALADRVLLLNRGHVHALGDPLTVFRDVEGLKAIGLDIPRTYRLALELGMAGPWDRIPSIGELARAIAERLQLGA